MNSEHFTDAELACPCCKVNKCTELLVNTLEALREKLGLPIDPDSGYRCAAHNKAVGGEANSQHLLGNAADIRVSGMTPAEVYRIAKTVPGFNGFGVAEHFIHVDVRQKPAKWTYGPDGKQRPWGSKLDELEVVTT